MKRSPNSLSSGLCSSQPRVKNFDLSSASATAKALLSNMANCVSTECACEMTARKCGFPFRGTTEGISGYTMTVSLLKTARLTIDQSVARHVGFDLSKIRMSSSISLIMTDLVLLLTLNR